MTSRRKLENAKEENLASKKVLYNHKIEKNSCSCCECLQMSLQSKGLWRRMEEVQVLKNRKVKSYSYCIALVKTLLHQIHAALKPSFPSLAGWRSGCSICLTFTALSSCLFVHLFLSGHFSPHLQHSVARKEVFSGPGWLAPLIDFGPSPSVLWHRLQRDTHMHAQSHAHPSTIVQRFTAFPITLASWFVY